MFNGNQLTIIVAIAFIVFFIVMITKPREPFMVITASAPAPAPGPEPFGNIQRYPKGFPSRSGGCNDCFCG